MTEKDKIQYIQILLALDGHNDFDIHATLNNMKETAEKKPSFWKKIISRCGTRCGKSAENA